MSSVINVENFRAACFSAQCAQPVGEAGFSCAAWATQAQALCSFLVGPMNELPHHIPLGDSTDEREAPVWEEI